MDDDNTNPQQPQQPEQPEQPLPVKPINPAITKRAAQKKAEPKPAPPPQKTQEEKLANWRRRMGYQK